jgi:hypothetical protein
MQRLHNFGTFWRIQLQDYFQLRPTVEAALYAPLSTS